MKKSSQDPGLQPDTRIRDRISTRLLTKIWERVSEVCNSMTKMRLYWPARRTHESSSIKRCSRINKLCRSARLGQVIQWKSPSGNLVKISALQRPFLIPKIPRFPTKTMPSQGRRWADLLTRVHYRRTWNFRFCKKVACPARPLILTARASKSLIPARAMGWSTA